MRRREFITLLGGATAWPLASRAQESGQVHRIGFLGSALDNPIMMAEYPLFTAELRKLGFSEGKNLTIEYRRADEGASRAFAAAAELVRSGVEVTVTFGPELTVKAAVAASQTVPIVMIAINFDPVAGGYVRSIARPDKNITGLLSLAPALATKQLELLVDAFPNEKPVAVLWETASADQFDAAQRAAQSLHIELHSHKLENPPYDFARAFQVIAQAGARMVIVLSGPIFAAERATIGKLAMQYRLPTMFTFKHFVEAGGLMSYGVATAPMFRRAASLVAKILRGAHPSDLPVEEPTNFEFALNLKTAKAIGVTIPTSLLLRADEVIE